MSNRLLKLACGFIATIFAACTSSTESVSSEFIARVDSVSGPTAVSGGIAAEQHLWGTVGPKGCTIFKEVRSTRVASTMDVTVIGEHVAGATCSSGSVSLNGLDVHIEPLILNDFSLVVHQPDGSKLVRRIYGE